MAYDALTESIALIESRELTPVARLSRRRRHAALAVDVAGDIAVTLFVRRSVGLNVIETHTLTHYRGEWHLLGGGGGPEADDALEHRPAELPEELLGTPSVDPRVLALEGGGGTLDGYARSFRHPLGRWINYSTIRVNAEVTRVAVGDREIPVPWHGRVVVAWVGGRAQKAVLLNHHGKALARAVLPASR
ncbi:hypothetical protein [Bogoriella caseilytica]|uniref:Uncharacterized protein n=1 Tax=Bogoriella caseilytica TaxID=56055 RepID=A0A3N2BC92_9MICO|nr:hypothetical protein [Bogoriella caseilytica]ROR72855.1 hypothetical protein EDD31_1216 [Bogoriella caseilytica]